MLKEIIVKSILFMAERKDEKKSFSSTNTYTAELKIFIFEIKKLNQNST